MTSAVRIGLFALCVAASAALARQPARAHAVGLAPPDVAVYEGIVQELSAGGEYYSVVGRALRTHAYATREVFNWRTPMLWMLLAWTPHLVAHSLLVGLNAALLFLTLRVTRRGPVASALFQAGTVMVSFAPRSIYLHEAWAGALLGVALCLTLLERHKTAILVALLALGLRELAAPYCVAMTCYAGFQRRWQHVVLWVVGGSVYLLGYGWHVAHVLAARGPDALAHHQSWISWDGLGFLLGTLRWHVALMFVPPVFAGIALGLLVIGLFSDRTPTPARIAAGAYTGFFLIAGQPFDTYWGVLAWPLWALTCGYGTTILLTPPQPDAVRAVRGHGSLTA